MTDIWALAGGKGGNGKTVIGTMLAVFLSSSGGKTLIIDADFDGPNLHNLLLDSPAPSRNLSAFFEYRAPLRDLIVSTPYPNLDLIVGNRSVITAERIYYQQKRRFLGHVRRCAEGYDYVIMDLGAGSSLNILDTFLMAGKKIVVTTPEVTSLENLYLFIKKLLFRGIKRLLLSSGQKGMLKHLWQNRPKPNPSIIDFIEFLKDRSTRLSLDIDAFFTEIKIHLIMNQVQSLSDARMGFSVKSILQKYFQIDSRYSGYLKYHPPLREIINNPGGWLDFSRSMPGTGIGLLVDNIIRESGISLQSLHHGQKQI